LTILLYTRTSKGGEQKPV